MLLLRLWLPFFILIAAFWSCDPPVDDELPLKADLGLIFQANHAGQPLVFFENVDYPGLNYMRYVNFRFYISDIQLIGQNIAVPVADVAMVDFRNSHNDLNGALAGEKLLFSDIEPGTYNTLRFGIGLTQDLNMTNPANYSLDHPLGYMGNYWPWRETYIFSIIEAQAATTGSTNVDIYPTFHSGSDQMYFYADIPVEIVLEPGKLTEIGLKIDMMEVLLNGDDPLDLNLHNFTHTGPDDVWLAALISNNLANAVKLRQD